jgi:hypothetical protein
VRREPFGTDKSLGSVWHCKDVKYVCGKSEYFAVTNPSFLSHGQRGKEVSLALGWVAQPWWRRLCKCQLVIYSGSVPVRFEHDWHLSGPVCIGINWSAQKTPGTGLALQLLATWHIWKSETHTHHRRHWQSSCCQSGCIGPTPHGPPGLASRHHTRYPTALDEKQSHALVLV